METRAHYVLIGVFTLLMIAAGFGLVLFFSGATGISVRRTYEIAFTGSVGGLAKGAPVTFSGLRVGEVTWVDLDGADPHRVIAYFQIFRNLILHKDTKAQLESLGLTGNVAIALSGGTPESPIINGSVGEEPIKGEASPFQSLLGRVESISAKIDDIASKVGKLVDDNGDAITDTVKNVDTFSKALSSNAGGLQDALAAIADLSKRAGPLADRLTKLTDDADQILKGVDPSKISHIVDNVSKFSDTIANSQADVKSVLDNASVFAKRLNDSTVNLQDTFARLNDVVKAIDPTKVSSVLDGADALSSTLKQNRGNIDQLIKSSSELAVKLDGSAGKIDGLLDNAAAVAMQLKDSTVNLPDTVARVDSIVKAIDPQKVASFMDGADALGATLQDNRGNIDKLIKSASELSAKLDESAGKIDGVLDGATNLLGSPEVKGSLSKVGDAAKSLGQLAEDLDVRVKEIAPGISRFANSGLRQFEALAIDGRRTIADVDRLVKSLEDNPSQIIFGAKKK